MSLNTKNLFVDSSLADLQINELVEWFEQDEGSRLRLPPIQRSIVWSNEQIVNFWDSLLRNYPAGMMLVHRANSAGDKHIGRDIHNKTERICANDFLLFDGQQRLATILLGFGIGPMSDDRRLWVDLRKALPPDLRFALRINSTGQPLGYQVETPNQKFPLKRRSSEFREWIPQDGSLINPQTIFQEIAEADRLPGQLIDAECAIPLSKIFESLKTDGQKSTKSLLQQMVGANFDAVDKFLLALQTALKASVVLKEIDQKIVSSSEEYTRFFGRVGQGGTRLTDDELIYSLVKYQYPYIHDRMEDIAQETGRFTSEVDLVLAALRVSKSLAPWEGAKEWEKAGRPIPKDIERFGQESLEATKRFFIGLVPESSNKPRLHMALKVLRKQLAYCSSDNPQGLPSILLARLPHDLLDVLILFAIKEEGKEWPSKDRQALIAFVLHWLLFVGNDSKAAYRTFVEAGESTWHFGRDRLRDLIRMFESEDIARYAPRNERQWRLLQDEVNSRDHMLATWEERFRGADKDDPDHGPGNAIRVLSTHRESSKRALMWLQRHYIDKSFPGFDPTSMRDEDLPVDLDHLIPQAFFSFDWRKRYKRLPASLQESGKFRWQRTEVGNSLGNLRFLSVSDNRSRQHKLIEPDDPCRPLHDRCNRKDWNLLIESPKPWTEENVASFQRLIDSRSLELARDAIEQTGIIDLLEISTGSLSASL